MRKIYSLLLMLLALTTLSATAQGFSATVTWDTPGAIKVLKGSSPAYGTEVSIAADATSYTITEKMDYMFIPTSEYYIETATMDGASQNLTKDYTNGGYYYKLAAEWSSNKYNGKNVELTTAAYVIEGEATLNINNGADKITFQVQDANGSTTQTIKPQNGSQKITIRNVDKKLYLKASGYPAPALHTCNVNGVAQKQAKYGEYTFAIAAGDVIDLALEDPATVSGPVDVKFVFTNNDPGCINTLRNWTMSKFIYPNELAASNYTLSVDPGTILSINLNEDYTLNTISTSAPVEITKPVGATKIETGTQFKIKEATTITIDATGIQYTPQTATLYTTAIEGLLISSEFDDADTELTTTEVATHPEGSVKFENVNYTLPKATTEYTINNISGKTSKFFFTPKDGYYIYDGAYGSKTKEDDDPADFYKLNGASMAFSYECPLYLDVRQINYDSKAVLYVVPGNNQVTFKSTQPDRSSDASFIGELSEYPQGYTTLQFDPSYNKTFKLRFMSNSITTSDKYYVYVDGMQISSIAESDAVFDGITLHNGSVVKAFAGAAPAKHTLNFTVAEGAEASLTYDEIVTTTDFSKPISNYGTVTYKFTPAEGTVILVGGTPLQAPYELTPVSPITEISMAKITKKLDVTVTPEDGKTVKALTKVTLNIVPTAQMMLGEESMDLSADAASYVTITKDGTSYELASVKAGDPSEESMPVIATLATPITEAGTYTVTFAEGLGYTTAYDEASGEFVRKSDSAVSPETTVSITVDPDFQYTWSFTPGNGEKELPMPTADDEYMYVYLSLPDAESLSEETFDTEGAVGPWISYNGMPVKPTTDEEEGDWQFIPDWATFGQPVLRIAINSSVFTRPGTLLIRAEEGAFTVDGNSASPTLEWSAFYGKELKYALYPTSGSTISDFNFTISFPESTTAEFVGSPTELAISNATQTYASPGMVVTKVENTDYPTFNITLPATAQEPPMGELKLSINAETFLIDGQGNPDIFATYIYEREVSKAYTKAADMLVIGEYGSYFTDLQFDAASTLSIVDNSKIKLYFDDEPVESIGFTYAQYDRDVMIIAEGTALMIQVQGQQYQKPGTLKLVVEAGALTIGGEAVDAFTETWTVVEPKEIVMDVLTRSELEGLEHSIYGLALITVHFPEATELKRGSGMIILRSGDFKYYNNEPEVTIKETPAAAAAAYASADLSKGKVAEISFPDVLDKNVGGSYTLQMNEGAFLVDEGYPTQSMNQTYNNVSTGISGAIADIKENVTVVTLDGRVVLQDAAPSALGTLPAGLYIVNGQKMILK